MSVINLAKKTFWQDDIGCFIPGECKDSLLLSEVHADSSGECLQECKDYEFGDDRDCEDFTYYEDSGASLKKCDV